MYWILQALNELLIQETRVHDTVKLRISGLFPRTPLLESCSTPHQVRCQLHAISPALAISRFNDPDLRVESLQSEHRMHGFVGGVGARDDPPFWMTTPRDS